MAGTLAVIPSNSVAAIRDQWEMYYSRFFNYPNLASASSDLIPLSSKMRNTRPRGTWISSSSYAFLRLMKDPSTSDFILTVCLCGKILEEHYVSKLHFTWPQVSCSSGFSERGITVMLVSYRDEVGQIQKFAMHFSSDYEIEAFANSLKEILKDTWVIQTFNSEFGHAISTEPAFLFSDEEPYRAPQELSTIPHIHMYPPRMPSSSKNTIEQQASTPRKETNLKPNVEGLCPSLPPSFTTLLTNCSSDIIQAQPNITTVDDLKSQIMKYMGDSSFPDILVKVERIMAEMG